MESLSPSLLIRACVSTALSLALVAPASAALVGDYTSRKVTEVYTYEDFGGGDVIFRVDIPIVGCEGGFWLRPTDPGFKTNVATVLLAYSTKSALRVWGFNDQLWTGSAAPTCRLYSLGLA